MVYFLSKLLSLSDITFDWFELKILSLKNKIRYLFIKHTLNPKGKHESMLPSLKGFALGLFLGPIGILIAYLFSKNKKLRHAAIAGGIISVILFILFIILIIVLRDSGFCVELIFSLMVVLPPNKRRS